MYYIATPTNKKAETTNLNAPSSVARAAHHRELHNLVRQQRLSDLDFGQQGQRKLNFPKVPGEREILELVKAFFAHDTGSNIV